MILEAADEFNFKQYKQVVVDDGTSVATYSQEEYERLCFTYHKSRRSKCKLDYCTLRCGDYMVIGGGFIFPNHRVGKLECLLTVVSGEGIFVAYKVPLSTTIVDDVNFVEKQVLTSKATQEILYVVRKEQFISRLDVYDVDASNLILIGQ